MSEFNHLSESIPEFIRDELNSFSLVLVDGGQVTELGQIHAPVELKSPFGLDLSQFIPNIPLSLEQFIETIAAVITDAQEREGIVPIEQVQLVQEYQPERLAELGDEVITFKILNRTPARLNRDGTGRPNRLPSYSYEYSNAEDPNSVLCVEKRPLDHTIELSAWAKTATRANARVLWLERLLIYHRWAFTSKGVKPFFFKDRGPDTMWNHAGTRLHQRPLKFFARLEEYNILAYPTIRDIQMEASLTFGGL